MNFSVCHYAGIILTLLTVVIIGVFSSRGIHNAGDFRGDSRQSSAAIVMGAIVGTLIGGSSTIGTAQLAFSYGISACWFTIGSSVACVLLGTIYCHPLYQNTESTASGIIRKEFGPAAGAISSVVNAGGMFMALIAQMIAAGAVWVLIFPDMTHDSQVLHVLHEGFDCIIGGSRTVKIAQDFGIKGIAFNIDEIMVENILLNASFIRNFQIEQEKKTQFMEATLRCSTEGLIMVDSQNTITSINIAGAEIFGGLPEELTGRDIDVLLQENQFVDIFEEYPYSQGIDKKENLVVLHREPVSAGGKILGEVISIRKAADVEKLDHKIQKNISHNGYRAKYSFNDIIGSSVPLENAKHMARQYAKYDSTVLIIGETGTGKELFAQSIHNESSRKGGPFVAINCAAFPENLIESELFGYEKGSFTGAAKEGKTGFFEKAFGGTIFLDEISELPISLQPKLLRVIQEREIIRVGGSRVVPINVRIISSSNKDLQKNMEKGLFKEDLYYRLSVLELKIPPLRARKEDIKHLAVSFIHQNNRRLNTHCIGIEPNALALLEKSSWRGNVRELQNIMERVMVLSQGYAITEADIRLIMNLQNEAAPPRPVSAGRTLKDHERALIEETLQLCEGNRAKAARVLGISQSTIWRKLKE